jgi:AcrR family transcriptional regulator
VAYEKANDRRKNPRGQGNRLRAEILRAALHVLDTQGTVDAVTLRAVARAAGVTAPALYSHFANLEALHAAMRDATFAQLLCVTDAADAGAADPVSAFVARCRAYVEFGMERPTRHRLIFTQIPGSSTASGEIAFDALVDVLDRCVAQGLSTSTDSRTDTAHLIAALHGVALTRTAMPGFPWPSLDETIRDITIRLACLHVRV